MIATIKRILVSSALVAVAGLAMTSTANAQFTLTDDNSTATVDANSSAGMDSWVVDGVNHLYQQWFWYRLGGDQNETSIDNLNLMTSVLSDTNGSGNDDTLYLKYGGNGFTIETTYTLRGGAFGQTSSDMAELIEITNTGSAPLTLSFFQYSDFDMGDTSGDDMNMITGGNTARQWDSQGFGVSETVATPMSTHFEAAVYDQTLASLEDGSITILNDNPGAVGDVTWAFQWDFVLGVGQSFQISKDKQIVPTPGSLALFGIGAVAIGTRRRRRA